MMHRFSELQAAMVTAVAVVVHVHMCCVLGNDGGWSFTVETCWLMPGSLLLGTKPDDRQHVA